MMKRKMLLSLLMAGLLMVAGSIGSAVAGSVPIPKMMTWTAYDVGSSGYMMAGHISTTLFEKHGIKIRIIPAGTDIPRVYPIRLKDAEVAFHGLGTHFMQEGVEEYSASEWGPQPVRALYFAQHAGLCVSVRGDSDIKTCADLKGKRVAAFPSTALTLISEAHLAYGGLTWDDVVRVETPSYGGAFKMMLAGKLDATHVNPTASMAYEMAGMPGGIRYLPAPAADKEAWARVKKIAPVYGPFTTAIGATLSADNPLETISQPYPIVMAYDFLSDEKAYILTKLLVESYPDYAKKHSSIEAYWTPEGSLRLFDEYTVPLHNGSIEYYKETGKWTPEREKMNNERIERQKKLKATWDAAMDEALEKKMKMSDFTKFWLKTRSEAGF